MLDAPVSGTSARPLLDPEFELILLATRRRVHKPVSNILLDRISWPALTETAGRHGVTPMLTEFLCSSCPELVPPGVRADLIGNAERRARKNLILALECVRLVDGLREQSVPVIAFKGPVLAQSLYGDLTGRECLDLDLIVPECHVERAAAMMTNWGYRSIYKENGRREYGKAVGQYLFTHPSTGVKVDLHWRLAPFNIPFPFPESEIWVNPAEIEIAGRSVPTLNPEHLAMFLAFHGTKERWVRLKWASDFARLIDTYQLDWPAILRRMKSAHCGRQLLVAVLLTAKLYELEPDRKVLDEAESDPAVRRLALDSITRMRSGAAETQLSKFSYAVSALERNKDRLQYCVVLATTLTISDYRSIALPATANRFYYFLRVFRLAGKAARLITIRLWTRFSSSLAAKNQTRPR